MKKIIKNSFLVFICLLSFRLNAAEPNISIYGAPKYDALFTHLEYVNPDAPKGGRIVMPEYGGFDSFNPFIFKGCNGISAQKELRT